MAGLVICASTMIPDGLRDFVEMPEDFLDVEIPSHLNLQ
jgi:hypothetical protein